MSHSSSALFWLEDQASSAVPFITLARAAGCRPFVRATPEELVALLDSSFGSPVDPKKLATFRLGFVIDLRIYGVLDLRRVGIDNVPTRGGYDVGYKFVECYLLDPKHGYSNCPICFLTERDLTSELRSDIDSLGKNVQPQRKFIIVNKKLNKDRDKFAEFLNSL
jgi:hypothetical protein